MLHPRPQNSRENCTWHNFNVVPTKAGYYATVGSYQSGISVFDFSNPAAPKEIAYADPAPLQTEPPTTGIVLGGDWSTYWHNGTIYQSDIKRGVLSWQLNLGGDATATQANAHLSKINTFALSNPQTQAVPTRLTPRCRRSPSAARRGRRLQGRLDRRRRTSPAPTTSAVESCVGTVADGTAARHDQARHQDVHGHGRRTPPATSRRRPSPTWSTASTSRSSSAAAPVDVRHGPDAADRAELRRVHAGRGKSYLDLGDGATIIVDRGRRDAQRLRPVDDEHRPPRQRHVRAHQRRCRSSAAARRRPPLAGGNVGGAAAPTPIAVLRGAAANRALTLTVRQPISANEALRAGTYGKTLTFTLSTTTP